MVVDALSHMPQALASALSTVSLDIPNCFKDEYFTDKDFGDAFRALKSLNPSPLIIQIFASYTLANDLLYYLDRICVPHNKHLRKVLLQKHHEVPFVAHPTSTKCIGYWQQHTFGLK